MNPCSIRPYTDADYGGVCRVHDRARPEELAGSCDPRAFVPLAEDTEDADWFARSTKWVAVEDATGTIVGFAGVDGAMLSWLYVDPAFSGRGIGRALLRHALAAIDEMGAGPAHTMTPAGNARAIALYESEGFRVTGTFEGKNAGYPLQVARLTRAKEGA